MTQGEAPRRPLTLIKLPSDVNEELPFGLYESPNFASCQTSR